MDTAVRVLVSGRVQGVSYRDWTRRQAQRHDIKGFVRNLADGRVEAVFAGNADAVEAMVDACRAGPPAAAVEGVERGEWQGEVPDGFEVRPTGIA